MLRRTQLEPAESIDMLRSRDLKKYTEVFAADGKRIGVALRYVHRPVEEVNLELKLYRSYLIVQSIVMGGPVYLPTVFIADYAPDDNRLTLAASMQEVAEELWNREPDFAARGQGVYEELPE